MYIRTKDGRILDFDKLNEVSKLSIDMEEEPIREAESIEELCDRFVVMGKETKEVISIVSFLAYAKLWSSCKYDIYGAVWTDKGLIFVAKMNDKGYFELI